MRLTLFVILMMLFVQPVYAQGTVYNSKQGNGNETRTLYNSRDVGSSAGPISIKNLIRGKTADSNYNNYSGVYHFGSSEKQYSMSMSPAQIRAKRAQDQARAERYAEQARQRYKQESQKRASSEVASQTEEYTSRFQNKPSENTKTSNKAKKKKQPVYLKKKDGLTMPEKVFGSIY